jgi:ribosomal-protein-alanine N-acetyltransferase
MFGGSVPAPGVVAGLRGTMVGLRYLEASDREPFLAMVRASRDLHRPWAYPPERPEQFDDLLVRAQREDSVVLIAEALADGGIAGLFTISQIFRGAFQSAYLGYYASAAYAGRGYMRDALGLVLELAFGPLALHRLEANIQPGNVPSIRLAKGAGFRLEGFSPRYLLIGGQWRDHERYAITAAEYARRN